MYKLKVKENEFKILKDDEVILDNYDLSLDGLDFISVDDYIKEISVLYTKNNTFKDCYFKTLEKLFKVRNEHKITYILKDFITSDYWILETDINDNIINEEAIKKLDMYDFLKF